MLSVMNVELCMYGMHVCIVMCVCSAWGVYRHVCICIVFYACFVVYKDVCHEEDDIQEWC